MLEKSTRRLAVATKLPHQSHFDEAPLPGKRGLPPAIIARDFERTEVKSVRFLA